MSVNSLCGTVSKAFFEVKDSSNVIATIKIAQPAVHSCYNVLVQ